jgi:DNA (cytosine-5)-methyltransferase 1
MLRTPQADEGKGGALREDVARARGNMVNVRDQMGQLAADNGLKVSQSLMPTPTVSDQYTDGLGSTQQSDGSMHSVTLAQIVHRKDLLPTPIVRDYKDGAEDVYRDGEVQTDTLARAVFSSGEVSNSQWGKFAPAIERWEHVLGRKAPAPTRGDGKDGNHRLSPVFTEWMMGLKEGHVTSPAIGLSRNDQLKACGNGVVPQQAVLALTELLGGIT